jgi:hypothetical protein
VALLRSALELAPTDPWAHLHLGIGLQALGQHAAAALFRACQARLPEDRALHQPRRRAAGHRRYSGRGTGSAVAQEVAPFGIEFTIVEPGAARTSFGAVLVRPPAMAVYDATPAGEMRRAVMAGTFPLPGDPLKMARAMIDSAERSPAPRRLALGSDTYALVRAALVDRLAVLDAQKEIAVSTDSDG